MKHQNNWKVDDMSSVVWYVAVYCPRLTFFVAALPRLDLGRYRCKGLVSLQGGTHGAEQLASGADDGQVQRMEAFCSNVARGGTMTALQRARNLSLIQGFDV